LSPSSDEFTDLLTRVLGEEATGDPAFQHFFEKFETARAEEVEARRVADEEWRRLTARHRARVKAYARLVNLKVRETGGPFAEFFKDHRLDEDGHCGCDDPNDYDNTCRLPSQLARFVGVRYPPFN
jgi:hypothetical protein